MPIRNLEKLFYPQAIAVVGASNRDGDPGQVVMHNLLHGGFEGPILPVCAHEKAIAGVLAYPEVGRLPIQADLAVICGVEHTAAEVIHALARGGTRAAILLADSLSAPHDGSHPEQQDAYAEARRCGLRLLGPDCLGVMVPGIGLNASIAHAPAAPGGVAFVSQSSTISLGVLDWARQRDIGFSYFISLGGAADVDFGDVIDYLGNDPMTRSILLYVEEIKNGRAFLSAGRGASRNKPILVIKSGRTEEGRHTTYGGERASGADEVYDAAFRRAGMLRVNGFGELFGAVETLGRSKPLKAERLALLANGRGIAALAVDALLLDGGRLARLSAQTQDALQSLLPQGWPRTNPVVLDGEAPPDRYGKAAAALLSDPEVDALMVLHAPVASVASEQAAAAVIRAVREARRPALVSWMGGERVAEARRLFGEAGIPAHDTPTQAVVAFMHMVRFRRNQELLIETPVSMPSEFTPAADDARAIIAEALGRGQDVLGSRATKAVLTAFGIPTAETRIARSPEEAASIAAQIGFPVALRLKRSGDGEAAGDRCGVEPFLESGESVRAAAEALFGKAYADGAAISAASVSVERMLQQRSSVREVMIAVQQDPVFGPVICFGRGGPAGEVLGDRAFALPPLNMSLARELISRTRVSRLLGAYGDTPPAALDALCLTLVQVSQMIVDIAEILALRIDPLFVDHTGAFAVDGWISVTPPSDAAERRLAIRPYPKHLEEPFRLTDGREVLLRPIRPEDEPNHYEFLGRVTPEDIRLRFFHHIRTLPHAEMARLTQIDYDREMAFIATLPRADGGQETLGVVRIITDLHNDKAEYAILIRSDLKGQGLGRKLMEKIIDYCRSRGTRRITGLILTDNRRMLHLVERLGFKSRRVPDDDVMEVELELDAAA
jgi:acetyltransferase